jgi:hypothetical protein
MNDTTIAEVSDAVVITDPEEIRLLSNDPSIDRDFTGPTTIRNQTFLKTMLQIFSVGGNPLPTMLPRTDPARAAAQDALWSKLNLLANDLKSGPQELEPLAAWVRGTGAEDAIGPLVQQCVGRLFVEDFTSTKESWAAACLMLEASSSSDVAKLLWLQISGQLEQAKALLSSMVNADLSAVNGIGVALHHIVDGLHQMRQLAADPAKGAQLAVDAVVDECLFAPGNVMRLVTADAEVGGCPFKKGAFLILSLGSASKGEANRDLVFLSQSWSRCPAENWVPALLEGVWKRASSPASSNENNP